ncbi:isopenicillin N synthase family dioxygenase [Vineibacter terrae]|uniref:isopenicillin N synthase family dioxygenase n=1 Tax=Vineibacter terrae TaxID=2586908 RepID=UPI002E30FCC4|nr:2OG-Fe(II) oxygenase family protein [Vineibacter terrae]HEX2887453.1 2OG-Fe(II) oxygenase family protein [Vineibacter terrae]
MTTAALPLIDAAGLAAGDPSARHALHVASRDVGAFRLAGVPFCRDAAFLARRFFALDAAARRQLKIARSAHFRGFSVMHSERDWREQVHFAHERPARASGQAWDRLEGPNLWPPDPALRRDVLALLCGAEHIGRLLLASLGQAIGASPDAFGAASDDAYTLLKLIRYHAQPGKDERRRGVAAHCDFSWLTLLFQDAVGGLQVMDRDGRWIDVPAAPDLVVVNIGELLQFATWGDLFAAPHRVVNPSRSRERLSVPVFINPPLAHTVWRVGRQPAAPSWPDSAHVHRVLPLAQVADAVIEQLHFGALEWRRKGENIWCAECCAAAPG